MRILIVEDEAELAVSISRLLRNVGYVADIAQSLSVARRFVEVTEYDLLILDRRLPDGEGLSLISECRHRNPNLAILILTAKDDIEDRIEGLDLGGDDYMGKPFATGELVARIRALVRRPGFEPEAQIQIAGLCFDTIRREFSVRGTPLVLAGRELSLLEALVRRAGRVVGRDHLFNITYSHDEEVMPNALEANLSRLRKRLRQADAGVDLTAVRGVGYMLTRSD